jgi:hypothetical protein
MSYGYLIEDGEILIHDPNRGWKPEQSKKIAWPIISRERQRAALVEFNYREYRDYYTAREALSGEERLDSSYRSDYDICQMLQIRDYDSLYTSDTPHLDRVRNAIYCVKKVAHVEWLDRLDDWRQEKAVAAAQQRAHGMTDEHYY